MFSLSALIDPPETAILDEPSPSPAPKPSPEISVTAHSPLDLEYQLADNPVCEIIAIPRNRRLAPIAAHFHVSGS
jgi:hypothetical protein